MTETMPRAIDIDLAANTLRLVMREPSEGDEVETASAEATMDIGASGRLVGVELGDLYVNVMPAEPGTEHLTRSATADVEVAREEGSEALLAVVVPRLGEGYEITYPSGNQ